MRILILSFYYPPDLSAGSFRCAALVKQLQKVLPENAEIHIATTIPNRFPTYKIKALEYERQNKIIIQRFKLPKHNGSILAQIQIFLLYLLKTNKLVKQNKYDLIYATSAKLFTGTLGSFYARRQKCKFYLDIRDIFIDTMQDVLSPKIALFVLPFLKIIERWTVKRANIINLVSPGFKDYFVPKYSNLRFSYHTNGVDNLFIKHLHEDKTANDKHSLTVLYAGTIGEGQGLDIILPQLAKLAAKKINQNILFRVVGDGPRKNKLIEKLELARCNNVVLILPMQREDLEFEYSKADVLFLHLNGYKAFEKVLPSKIFEYASIGKPIWAGVAGFAGKFIKQEIPNAAVFKPGDALEAISVFSLLSLKKTNREKLLQKYNREKIMKEMATDLYELIENH